MKHVLVCRLDNVGDVLLTGPAVRAVAAGADRVTFLCSPQAQQAAELLPGVDDVLVHSAGWISPGSEHFEPAAVTDLIRDVRNAEITHAVIFTSFHQSPLPTALVLRMAGVECIAAISDDYPGTLLDVRHRIDPDLHEVQRNLSLVATLGFRLPADDDGRLHIRRPARPFTGLEHDPFIAVHPGASAPARTAPPRFFKDVVWLLVSEGWRVVVTGTPAERDLTHRVAGRQAGVTDLGGRTQLADLASIFSQASGLITGNTGPAHLAAAVGLGVTQLFPPTVPASRWHPWGVPHAVLGDADISCAGCRAQECPLSVQQCLAAVEPEDVVDAMRHVIADRDYLYPPLAIARVVA